jgi:hypothetical protein
MAKQPSHHGERWAPADDRRLRDLAAGNTPTRLIAWQLGRTDDAIYSRANEIGVSLKPTNQSPYNRRSKS